jgi:hypothetical protein
LCCRHIRRFSSPAGRSAIRFPPTPPSGCADVIHHPSTVDELRRLSRRASESEPSERRTRSATSAPRPAIWSAWPGCRPRSTSTAPPPRSGWRPECATASWPRTCTRPDGPCPTWPHCRTSR